MDDTVAKSVSNEEMEDDSNVITLDEFIEEETRLETDADAVLGPSDDKNCTYNQGYMGRQALYACKTCRSEDNARVAGVCLACTYHCHEGHDFIELYTKRNFRCDCGNSRFKNKQCNLEPNRDPENANNNYNHNFEGLYCTCKRPYPDPEDSVPDEMIQCIICEDWYHTRHLHADLPPEENYAEMICADCSERLTFLKKYLGYSVTKVSKVDGTSNIVDVAENGDSIKLPLKSDEKTSTASSLNGETTSAAKEESTKKYSSVVNGDTKEASNPVVNTNDLSKVPTDENKTGASSSITANGESSSSQAQVLTESQEKASEEKQSGCLLDNLKDIEREKKGATFWPQNFRSLLCTCDSCKEMYRSLEVVYLVDRNDTVQSYEEKGRNPLSSTADSSKHSLDRVLSMLSNIGMDRFCQAEAILNYNDLKSNLRDYLSKFAENKKVVREEDIREFFTQMNARKRQKMDLSYSCR